ncbi:MAG: twin-arginine translocase subunit TatC [Candidatus Scalindua rubra]|uniref:Sec-independent protein translocase protein TatC n=1 Tax=Candidatus Scalindua brodae TaxID=237368 RepID=A0A0B0EI15_9BACT|nr:MAG: sec independent translocase tatC [Candidatus Scalindua brodae]MBZ0110023.1 twin-arginine translocase subunit TatC [Candidatus Scalindua rubra]TWU36910.1 Sec-independent protein translocase protein TatCy [Candidatus Brocadiaceae bacterium S225]
MPEPTEEEKLKEKRLPISEHLEELRARIIKSILIVIVLFFINWFFKAKILDIIKRPHSITMKNLGLSQSLQVLSYQEGFYAYIKLCLITSVFMAYPIILYQVWRFVEAGLFKKERRYVKTFAPISYIAFVTGVLFGYYFLIPYGLQFLIKILGGGIQPMITMSQYISLVTMLTLALGIVFQLPLVMLFISKIGMLKAEDFIKWRMYAILIIFILAAVITPPDPFTQIMTALPMIILYEVGILAIRPTKKAVQRFGILLGSGILLVYVIFLVFTLPTKANFLESTGTVKILPNASINWQPLSSESKIHNGATLKTGKGSKASFLLKDGTYVIMDVNTTIKFVKSRNLNLIKGQILIAIKADDKPFMVAAKDNVITSNNSNIDIRVSKYTVFVTVTKGKATVVANGQEKKIFEGRQLRFTTGGKATDINKIIKWAKEMQKKLKEQNKRYINM